MMMVVMMMMMMMMVGDECGADSGQMQLPLLVQDDDVIVGSPLPPQQSFQEVKKQKQSKQQL